MCVMNRIYLVRHGENWANITKEFSHRKVDYSLTPKGVLQAQQTAAYFQGKEIHAVYSSPLKRALETAEIIAAPLGLPVTVLEGLREINVGDLEGQPVTAELWAFHNGVIAGWLAGRREVAFPGGEDYNGLCCRLRASIEQMVAGRDGQSIVAVGHGGTFAAMLPDLCLDADIKRLCRSENPNCSISEILVHGHNEPLEGHLIAWASHAHLHGAAADLVPGAFQSDSPT